MTETEALILISVLFLALTMAYIFANAFSIKG